MKHPTRCSKWGIGRAKKRRKARLDAESEKIVGQERVKVPD